MEAYRLNKEPYHTDPLSVEGSRRHGGRWNPKGVGILYTSATPELSLLETLVHLPPLPLSELPGLWLSTLMLPDEPQTVFYLDAAKLPASWRTGTLAESQSLLMEWLLDPFCLGLGVPSIVMPLSYNILLHPQHADFKKVEVFAQRKFPLDPRLRK
ncbi:RES family NAD+ phosphorylase [Persicitalea jodogahamensis]|uniref:RES domain-containing protein n=1 Tax=Persicitalea jodogahamensis TaxID=402147 RepID=A0A8J3G9E2_9BACT|nr:RES family NAD+ phosphorylase [Persicitalea jodogahamensis]GHB65510.1 hypothetical protein GCM10007390_19520 [Persicitalea jodogahamensis]